jgi:hypothetical protein
MKPAPAIRLLSFLGTALALLAAGSTCPASEPAPASSALPRAIGYTPPGERTDLAQADTSAPPVQPSAQFRTITLGQGEVEIGGDEAAPAAAAWAEPAGLADAEYADTDPSALQDFRGALDPYGGWRDDPTYGTVWVPAPSVVGADFTPYVTGGHWAYGDDYVWVSDYDWGWAPFHYGRWVYGVDFGWGWIPGRVYAGAWVSWRYGWGDWGYVGWAPLPPTWCWRGGVAVGIGFVPRAPYAFVGSGHLFAPALGGHVIAGPAAVGIAAHTQPWVGGSVGVAGHFGAHPVVGGPPPSTLGIAPSSVRSVPVADRGLAQAQAYARPATAAPLGAHAPQIAASRASAAPAYSTGARPYYGAARSVAPSPLYRSAPAYSAPAYRAPAYSAPAYRGPAYASPAYRGPAYSAPVYRGPVYSAPAARGVPSYGGGAVHSAPVFHPSVPSGGGFGGGGHSSGGFHGGGGRGGGHR